MSYIEINYIRTLANLIAFVLQKYLDKYTHHCNMLINQNCTVR